MIDQIDSRFFGSLHAAFRDGDGNIDSKREEAENVSRVEQIIQLIVRGDFAALEGLFADDVVLDIIGSADNPIAGKWQGRQQVIDATRRNFSLLEDQKPEIESVVAQGNTVVVVAREQGRFVATGQSYDFHWVQLYTFKEGKLIRFRELADSVEFRDAGLPKENLPSPQRT